MIVFKKVDSLRKYLDAQISKKKTIGFAPTMGALHDGHLSLIEIAKDKEDIAVCSIFVNPTQFNESSDFEKYPITIQSDLHKLLEVGCDVVFLPDVEEIYPDGREYVNPYDLGDIAGRWEGAHRPGHFDGVVQVVDRLLNIVQPNTLCMGQKDFQQFSIIQRMLDLKGGTTELVICPIVREADGLAMSSRNVRLNQVDRRTALSLSKALQSIKDNYKTEGIDQLIDKGKEQLSHSNIKLEYLTIVDGKTLIPLKDKSDSDYPVALVAAWVGDVRLIDNFILK